jgi:hypothetical protein
MKIFKLLVTLLAIFVLALAASCVTREIPVTESYQETEYQPETYTATEEYEVNTPHSRNIFQMQKEVQSESFLFLFNKDKTGNVRWAQWTHTIRLHGE